MATLYSTQFQAAYNDEPSSKIQPGDFSGRVRNLYAKYSLDGDLALNDVIKMGKLPKGARVLEVVLKHSALGAGTLDVGWSASADASITADPDGWIDGAAVTALGTELASAAGLAGHMAEFLEEVDIEVLVKTDTSATSGDIEISVQYVIE